MKWFYIVTGSALCLLFLYAGFTGWTVADTWSANTWGARGASSFNHK